MSSISSTVHWRRNSSGGSTVCPSGVRVAWKAYRWLLNISPGGPRAFFFSKLKTCATPSKTNASPITANLLGVGQEAELAPGRLRQTVDGPRLVPDDLDVGAGQAGQGLDPLGGHRDAEGRHQPVAAVADRRGDAAGAGRELLEVVGEVVLADQHQVAPQRRGAGDGRGGVALAGGGGRSCRAPGRGRRP